VDTNTAGTAHHGAATEIYQERSHPQLDCAGSYLWLWERLIQTEGGTEVIARQVHRDRPPSGPRKVT
jgi:hypothetical protein